MAAFLTEAGGTSCLAQPAIDRQPDPTSSAPSGGECLPVSGRELERLLKDVHARGLADRGQWLRLGHWPLEASHPVASRIDDTGFFLAGEGASPADELKATLRAMHECPAPGKMHASCRFPARFRFLERHVVLNHATRRPEDCPGLQEFRTRLRPETVSLVFSAHHLDNPVSAFGHTLLRLVGAKNGGASGLYPAADHSINFAATPNTANPLAYAIGGIGGKFKGTFSVNPYYFKVRQYNDHELRDIWEYDLELSSEARQMLVDHAWELTQIQTSYYYLSVNCSFQVLALLEVAEPKLDLVSRLRWPVLPVDTLRVVSGSPRLVTQVRQRRSMFREFKLAWAQLQPNSQQWLKNFLAGNAASQAGASAGRTTAAIDTGLMFLDWKLGEYNDDRDAREKLKAKKKHLTKERLRRRTLRMAASVVPPALEASPDKAYGAKRMSLGTGWDSREGAYGSATVRLGAHSLADPGIGYADGFRLEYLSLALRLLHERSRLEVDQAWLIRMLALHPLHTFSMRPSWGLDLGGERGLGADGEAGFGPVAAASIGTAWSSSQGWWTLFGLARFSTRVRAQGDGVRGSSVGFAIGPVIGMRVRLGRNATALLQGRCAYWPAQLAREECQASLTSRWGFMEGHAIALSISASRFSEDYRVSWNSYL